MEANDIVKRLLEDPSTRREIMRAIAEARGVEVNLDDPPGWLEDALENVYKIIIELVKELGETIIKASTEAFKPLAEGIITEMFKVLEAPAPVTFDEAVDRASRWLSISASMNVAIVAIVCGSIARKKNRCFTRISASSTICLVDEPLGGTLKTRSCTRRCY